MVGRGSTQGERWLDFEWRAGQAAGGDCTDHVAARALLGRRRAGSVDGRRTWPDVRVLGGAGRGHQALPHRVGARRRWPGPRLPRHARWTTGMVDAARRAGLGGLRRRSARPRPVCVRSRSARPDGSAAADRGAHRASSFPPADGPGAMPFAHLHTQWPGDRNDPNDPALLQFLAASGPFAADAADRQALEQKRLVELARQDRSGIRGQQFSRWSGRIPAWPMPGPISWWHWCRSSRSGRHSQPCSDPTRCNGELPLCR